MSSAYICHIHIHTHTIKISYTHIHIYMLKSITTDQFKDNSCSSSTLLSLIRYISISLLVTDKLPPVSPFLLPFFLPSSNVPISPLLCSLSLLISLLSSLSFLLLFFPDHLFFLLGFLLYFFPFLFTFLAFLSFYFLQIPSSHFMF